MLRRFWSGPWHLDSRRVVYRHRVVLRWWDLVAWLIEPAWWPTHLTQWRELDIALIRWLSCLPGGQAIIMWEIGHFRRLAVEHAAAVASPPRVFLPTVLADRQRTLLNVYRFCRRGVGIAYYDAWRLVASVRPVHVAMTAGIAWGSLALRLTLFACWLAFLWQTHEGALLAVLPTVAFNSGTGSDTAASGYGPGTAVAGTGASLNGTTTVNVSADTPNLSSIAAGDLLWVATSSGRQYSIINSVDDGLDTITVATTYSVTESAKNWGVGGTRATLDHADSRTVFADMGAGWHFSLEDNQTITSALTPTVAGSTTAPIIWKSSVAGTKRTITQSTASATIFNLNNSGNQQYHWRDLNFAHSNATKGAAFLLNTNSSVGNGFIWLRCSTDTTNPVSLFISRTSSAVVRGSIIGCEIKNCTGAGVDITASSQSLTVVGCYVHDNGGNGITCSGGNSLVVLRSIFDTNTGDGLFMDGTWTNTGERSISNCVFYGNSGDGIEFNAANVSWATVAFNNIFVSNGGYGIRANASAQTPAYLDYNAYYNNTSGQVLNLTAGDNSLTLTGDPFTNAASGDFSLNNTAGAGADVRAAGAPTTFGSATTNYLDIGAAQHQDAGGGGLLTHPGMAGGMRG